MAPNIAGEVTDLTPEVWEKLKFNREFSFNAYQKERDALRNFSRSFLRKTRRTEKHTYDREVAKIKFLEVEQPKFYNRYIDADGVPNYWQ